MKEWVQSRRGGVVFVKVAMKMVFVATGTLYYFLFSNEYCVQILFQSPCIDFVSPIHVLYSGS